MFKDLINYLERLQEMKPILENKVKLLENRYGLTNHTPEEQFKGEVSATITNIDKLIETMKKEGLEKELKSISTDLIIYEDLKSFLSKDGSYRLSAVRGAYLSMLKTIENQLESLIFANKA